MSQSMFKKGEVVASLFVDLGDVVVAVISVAIVVVWAKGASKLTKDFELFMFAVLSLFSFDVDKTV